MAQLKVTGDLFHCNTAELVADGGGPGNLLDKHIGISVGDMHRPLNFTDRNLSECIGDSLLTRQS